MNRIAGLETEYGCLTTDPKEQTSMVQRVRNWIFEKHRFGLADLHQRDWDEPAGNGGFLFNGGRCYVDMGHLEYCTPECLSLIDILRFDNAGDAIINQALKEMKLADQVCFIRNNVDHYSGTTFGCHENYLVRRAAPLSEMNVQSLLAFLTLRVLFCGAGKVGVALGAEARGELMRPGTQAHFQVSQRADYINNDLFEWVQFNRAIINTRDEPLADARKYRRLHLLHGDTNVLPTSLLLKVGSTALVLDLLELDCLPKVVLADAVSTFRTLSHQPDGPWRVTLADGRQEDPISLLAQFHALARREFDGRDAETTGLLKVWGEVLSGLSSDPASLIGQVDWISKRWLFEQFIEHEDISWNDPWLRAQDLEFHQTERLRSLGLAMARTPGIWELWPADIAVAMRQPPDNTRACARVRLMHMLKNQTYRYYVDWEVIDAEGMNTLNLMNPFDAHPAEMVEWCKHLDEVGL